MGEGKGWEGLAHGVAENVLIIFGWPGGGMGLKLI